MYENYLVALMRMTIKKNAIATLTTMANINQVVPVLFEFIVFVCVCVLSILSKFLLSCWSAASITALSFSSESERCRAFRLSWPAIRASSCEISSWTFWVLSKGSVARGCTGAFRCRTACVGLIWYGTYSSSRFWDFVEVEASSVLSPSVPASPGSSLIRYWSKSSKGLDAGGCTGPAGRIVDIL